MPVQLPAYSAPPIGGRLGLSIADLIQQRGDIAARRSAASGQIWGNAIQQIGGLVSQAIQGIQAQKEEKKSAQIFDSIINDPQTFEDPQYAFTQFARAYGPEKAMVYTKGIESWKGVKTARSPEDAMKVAPDLARAILSAPEASKPTLYSAARSAAIDSQIAKPEDLPEQWGPDVVPLFEGIAQIGQKAPGTRQIKITNPDQSETIKVVPDVPGQEFTSAAPPPPKPEKSLAEKVAEATALADARARVEQKYKTAATTKEDTKKAAQFKTAIPVVKAVAQLSERINTLQGVVAKASGEAEKAKAKLNLNDDVAEYESLISGFTPLVARALGHTGVLTEQDVQSVKALFPRPEDSKSLRDRKISRIESLMSQMPGMDPEAFNAPSDLPAEGNFFSVGDYTVEVVQ